MIKKNDMKKSKLELLFSVVLLCYLIYRYNHIDIGNMLLYDIHIMFTCIYMYWYLHYYYPHINVLSIDKLSNPIYDNSKYSSPRYKIEYNRCYSIYNGITKIFCRIYDTWSLNSGRWYELDYDLCIPKKTSYEDFRNFVIHNSYTNDLLATMRSNENKDYHLKSCNDVFNMIYTLVSIIICHFIGMLISFQLV